VAIDAQKIAASSGRPAEALTRRDVARALLAGRAAEAQAALPGLRRQLIAAGNPMSAAFWDSAAALTQKIADGTATIGEVQDWLEATGTEPAAIIGMFVWEDQPDRTDLQNEMYGLLVAHLEDLLERGLIDPDRLAGGGAAALREHRRLQEEWMMAPLPDGRVPMWVLTDEEDEEFLAEWDAAEAEALAELRGVLGGLPERPVPKKDLRAACERIREAMKMPGWPRDLLAACGGVDPENLPADDAELWLRLAAGIVSPQDELARGADEDTEGDEDDEDDDGYEDEEFQGDYELTADEESMVALCALDHNDWLAAVSALARGGPGTAADADALARYVSDFDPDDADDQADAAAGMFQHAVGLWQAIGAVDDDERLTPLGWWGLPEAVQRAWQPRE
jgi:hypothetical protein